MPRPTRSPRAPRRLRPLRLFPQSRALLRKALPSKFTLSPTSLFLLLLISFLLFLPLLRLLLPPLPAPSPVLSALFSHNINIWHPDPRCQGSFRTSPARYSPYKFPYAVIRDAVIDRRPATKRLLGLSDGPGVFRIVLYLTVHLSTSITSIGSVVSVPTADIDGHVEYATFVTKFLLSHAGKPYNPGRKDRFGREIGEWQVGLRLKPRGHLDAVARAMHNRKALNITLMLKRYNESEMPWNVVMGLDCVMGWALPGVNHRGNCAIGGEGVRGAVVFSGSALYGEKRRSREHYREVANFAARALGGELRFDAVVMSVVAEYSKEDMYQQCGGRANTECLGEMEKKNHDRLEAIAGEVRTEMMRIGVPAEWMKKVILVPSCRLGSDANVTEIGDTCRVSKRYGQYYASFFTYAMVAPFFKWAASYDMDEFVASVPSSPIAAGPAHEILDKADRSLRKDNGHLVFQWLNFRVRSSDDSRHLSQDIINSRAVRLVNRENVKEPGKCYEKTRDFTAKSAVRCDIGLGFTIHHPVVTADKSKMELRQGNRVYKGLRTWHARLKKLKWAHVADCDYERQQ